MTLLNGTEPITTRISCSLNDSAMPSEVVREFNSTLLAERLEVSVRLSGRNCCIQEPRPYGLEMRAVDPISYKDISRNLRFGDYVLIKFMFRLPAMSMGEYVAVVYAEEDDPVTLGCPFVHQVGSDIKWNEQPLGCFTRQTR